MANDHVAPIFRDLLKGFVSDCVNGSSEPRPSSPRAVVCQDHPGGPFTIYEGRAPVVETECVLCCFVRQEAEAKETYRKNIAWQKKPAQTPEEIAAAPDPFRGFREGE